MGINLDKPHLWKQDIIQSVDLYNTWFMDFAPKAFRETRVSTAKNVEEALKETNYLNKYFSRNPAKSTPKYYPYYECPLVRPLQGTD